MSFGLSLLLLAHLHSSPSSSFEINIKSGNNSSCHVAILTGNKKEVVYSGTCNQVPREMCNDEDFKNYLEAQKLVEQVPLTGIPLDTVPIIPKTSELICSDNHF